MGLHSLCDLYLAEFLAILRFLTLLCSKIGQVLLRRHGGWIKKKIDGLRNNQNQFSSGPTETRETDTSETSTNFCSVWRFQKSVGTTIMLSGLSHSPQKQVLGVHMEPHGRCSNKSTTSKSFASPKSWVLLKVRGNETLPNGLSRTLATTRPRSS